MTSRRTVIAGAVALPLLGAVDPAQALLDRAIAAGCGRRALQRARVLRWTGTATIHDGKRTIDIGVHTLCEPFVRAVSKSWLLADGPAKSRTMTLGPDGAWLERAGQRMPMPDAMRIHETQQFGVYGLMRLVDLDRPGVSMFREGRNLRAKHPQLPEALLIFDDQARLIGLENAVADSEGPGTIPQRFAFEGRMPGPIAWPRRLTIAQRGSPYFELTLATFSAGPV